MRKHKIISILGVVLVILSLTWSYISLPDTVILYKDREWKSGNVPKLTNLDNSIETVKDAIIPRKAGDYNASLSIFGIPCKRVTLKVLEDDTLIPGGQTIGIRLYSDGLVVVAVGRVNPEENLSPAEEAGIKEGDVIVKINGEKVGSPDSFSKKIAKSEGEVTLEIKTGDKTRSVNVLPVLSEYDKVKRIGLWVRDSTAGVGTLTYIDPENGCYGALGHAVSDTDTGVRFEVLKGSIEECKISGIVKGEKGAPGELQGVFFQGATLMGDITKNTGEGIFGRAICPIQGEAVKLGHKSEVEKGDAILRTSLDGKTVRDYEIKIVRVNHGSKNAAKGFVIEVTDEELLEKTGGIVQGMSGSPILQEGRLIGAVTHVCVNL